jgi:hypothetical protein
VEAACFAIPNEKAAQGMAACSMPVSECVASPHDSSCDATPGSAKP